MNFSESATRSHLNRSLNIMLMLCLVSTSTPAAPLTIVSWARESSTNFAFWFRASGWSGWMQRRARSARKPEKQTERNARVARLQIFPGDVSVQVDEPVHFAAIGFDASDSPVAGVKFKWSIASQGRKKGSSVSPQGEFRAVVPGTFKLTAEGAGQRAEVNITVASGGPRPKKTEAPTSVRQVNNRQRPQGIGKLPTSPADSHNAKPARQTPKSKTSQRTSKSSKSASYAHRNWSGAATAAAPMIPEDGWTDDNYWSSTDPINDVGDPPGNPIDGGAGSGNFQFAAPILSLPGRGISLSLAAAYNSRLWNKAGSQITYDIDRSWPAPGFSISFGKLLGMGVYNGGMLVDADGTRHPYAGTISAYGQYSQFSGHTTDGSFVDYWYATGTGGGIVTATAKLPNSTVVTYGAPGPGAVYPTNILDANGNYITITYVSNAGPRISTITDTLGRAITFHYNSNNLLTAIKAPGLESGTRELVRFHYQQLTLSYDFSGLTEVVRESSPWVIDAIYYPGTGTGYWFGDSDSYSSYGMLAKVEEQRGMGFSASSETDMGSVSEGSNTRTETYNYDLSANSNLTDAPTYTQMAESWTRDGTSTTDSATTSYSVTQNSTPRTVTITLPNGTTSTQYSYNHSGYFDDGLVYHDETRDSSSNLLQSSTSEWQEGAYNSPRPTRIEKTDERSQTTAAEFSYGSVYNQVTEVRDYNYGDALIRATHTTYENSSNYTNRHIFNLPLTVSVYDSDNATRLSLTEYEYDGQTLTETPDVNMHDVTHDPYAPEYEQCDCNQWDQWQIECLQWNCYQTSAYNPGTAYRGNVTQITTYADAAGATGAMTETRRYDVTGNMIKASTACCEQTTIEYSLDYQFAYPESKTRGSATDGYAQVKVSATYDFGTGLDVATTDPNGRESETSYDPDTLRPISSISSTGAHTDFAYDDEDMTVTSTTYLAGESGGIADQSVKYLNGHGQVRVEKARGPNNGSNETWDAVNTVYDNLGQVYQQSRPYRVGTDTPVYSTVTYDALGRTRTVTAPDGSVTETFYNESSRPSVASSSAGETTRVKDAWGRERWGRTDASGRLVEVVEPNPTGDGTVASNGYVTTYAYSTLGNLITVTQENQTRSFAYDSFGRLTAQKLAETEATLNSSGTYVGTSSGVWSDVFTYDSRSNLTSRTDARGVKTVYDYNSDPLNRLQSVSWDTSGFGDTNNPINSAATVSYSYRTKSSASQLRDVTQLSSVTASGVSTKSYDYDDEGRAYIETLTLNSRSSYPFVTTFTFDSLDRVTDVQYPAEYGNGGGSPARKIVHHTFDIASRLTSLTYDSQTFASNIVYNAASQTTSLNIGSGTNQITESYSYGAQTGLLDSQTVARGSTTLLNLSYDYANSSGKRTGQLVKLLNNLDHAKDRGYTYDALGRLVQATGGSATPALSTQTYSYDRYGNRTAVSANGYSAKRIGSPTGSEAATTATGSINKPADPKVDLPTDLIAKITNSERDSKAGSQDTSALDDASRSLLKASSKGNAEVPPPSSPPTFTDPDLLAAGVYISAVHITELRAAINNLRVRLGMSQVIWAKPTATGGLVTSGGSITAEPIIEMRTVLDQALGAPSPAYAGGLAQGQPILAVHIQELRDRVVAGWNASSQIPRDGHASLSYDTASNRITTSGFAYDKTGNQVRALIPGGSGSQRYKYDAANRMVQVLADNGTTVLASYTYGDTNERLIAEENGSRTYYTSGGSVEYTESGTSAVPLWSKSYVYLGARVLAMQTPYGSGGEATEFHHPDRLGTRLITYPSNGNSVEQVNLPFGTPLYAESTGATNKRFTSYDRNATTGLDYANNRHYDSQQGRFTQVDPIGMSAVSLVSPQTLNLYAYCANDPVNYTDPSGLSFLGSVAKIFKIVKKVFKWALVALAVAVAVVAIAISPAAALGLLFKIGGLLIKLGIFKATPMIYSLTTGAISGGGITIGVAGSILAGLAQVGAIASYVAQSQDPSHKGSAGGDQGPGGGRSSGSATGPSGAINVGVVAVVLVAAEAELLPLELVTLAEMAPWLLLAGAAVGAVALAPTLAEAIPSSTGNTATNSNTAARDRSVPRTNRRYRNRWSCFSRGHMVDYITHSVIGMVTGAGHGPSRGIAADIAIKAAQNNTPPGTYSRHVKITKCIER